MSETELYEATRKWWVMNPDRHDCDWAFCVVDGKVRAVYAIHDWERHRSREGGRSAAKATRRWSPRHGYLRRIEVRRVVRAAQQLEQIRLPEPVGGALGIREIRSVR